VLARLKIVGALAVLSWLCGCGQNHYEISMKPEGEVMERTLTCWRSSGDKVSDLPTEELDRLGKCYSKREAVEDVPGQKKHRFQGRFTARLPSDLGGAGTFQHWVSSMGSTSIYVERFGGSDDLSAELTRRQQAVNQLTDYLIGWLRQELGRHPRFKTLRTFCDGPLRRDLQNLAIYGWGPVGLANQKEDAWEELLIRIGQYLLERGYFSVEQVPTLMRAFENGDGLIPLIGQMIGDKMGIDDPERHAELFGFLADSQRLEKSLGRYLRTTPAYRKLQKDWKTKRRLDPKLEEPKPSEVLNPIWEVIHPIFPVASATARLSLSTRPYRTNGEWDAEAGYVMWKGDVDEDRARARQLPALAYAFWSNPDRSFQEQHFGKVCLEGEALGQYCLWLKGLNEAEAKQWNELISGLEPGTNGVQKLQSFSFPGEARDEEDLADLPRKLILAGLDPEK
jgi:hypothetical protein